MQIGGAQYQGIGLIDGEAGNRAKPADPAFGPVAPVLLCLVIVVDRCEPALLTDSQFGIAKIIEGLRRRPNDFNLPWGRPNAFGTLRKRLAHALGCRKPGC